MNTPTNEQIDAIAQELARSVGPLHVWAAEIAFHADCRFPGMTDRQFAIVREQAAAVTAALRAAELRRMWA